MIELRALMASLDERNDPQSIGSTKVNATHDANDHHFKSDGCNNNATQNADELFFKDDFGFSNVAHNANEYLEEEEEEEDENFAFAVTTSGDSDWPGITADELFDHGVILPAYPVFGRATVTAPPSPDLRPPPDSGELPAAGEFCPWSPASAPQSPERCKKSGSTGSARRWRLRDLVGRSHSDGKEKFVFIDARRTPPTRSPEKPPEKSPAPEKTNVRSEMKVRTATVTKAAAAAAAAAHRPAGGRRRQSTFLPYRQNLLGFFTSANAFTQNHHPY